MLTAHMLGTQRGLAMLGMVMAIALTASIAAYATLLVATSQARIATVTTVRSQSRYLAEAGLVIATQKLIANPAYCGGTERVDTDGDGVVNASDPSVVVTVTSCGAGNTHQITAAVNY